MTGLIDWDAPPSAAPAILALSAGSTLLALYHRLAAWCDPEQRDALRAIFEARYRHRLVRVANRAVLRDTLRRKALTPAAD